MEKLIKISLDILELERSNMTPILNDQGKIFNDEEIMLDIAKSNGGLYNLFCHYTKDDLLLGYFRFNFDENKNIIVKSVQLRNSSKVALKNLLYIGYQCLCIIKTNPIIYAWVNSNNNKSIKLLERLGFKYSAGHKDASKFECSRKNLLQVLIKLGMDKVFTQETHPGNFPIRVLRHNIPYTVETHRPYVMDRLKNAINDGKINPKICCKISDEFGLINVHGETNQITIHEQFLAFLWSFIYSMFVIVEEGVQTKILNSGSNLWDGKIDDSRPIVKRAQDLYLWSKSLPKKYSKWPMYLPNPEIFYSAEEQFYITKVNGIYLKAVTYLINHEIAHCVNEHNEILLDYNKRRYSNLTEKERLNYIEIESDADRYAREEITGADDDEKIKFINGISIVLSHCASLFAIKHPKDLNAYNHPDIDNRIFHSINYLQLSDQKDIDYLYLIAAISCNLFFAFNKEELDKIDFVLSAPREFEDPKEYFSHCLSIIDEIKLAYLKLENQ